VTDDVDTAFDQFIAAGLAPWIVARNGDGFDAVINITMPAEAPDLPRLDATFLAGLLMSGKDVNLSWPSRIFTWYIPEFALLGDGDPAFRFAVTQKAGEVTQDGRPVNQATLTLSLRAGLPARLASVLLHSSLITIVAPDVQPVVTLSVPVTAPDGSVHLQTAPGTVAQQHDGIYQMTFALSQGIVKAVYERLTDLGGATLEVGATYSGLQLVLAFRPDTGFPIHGPVFQGWQFTTFGDGQHGGAASRWT
jgi:hypothetical protein